MSSGDKSVGWASIHDSADLDLTLAKVTTPGRIVLALRIDILKPPADEVKRLVKVRQREIEAQRMEPLSASSIRDNCSSLIACCSCGVSTSPWVCRNSSRRPSDMAQRPPAIVKRSPR